MKEGNERACDNCGKIYEAIYFPYKSVNHCINCYENDHGVVLHKHRKKIGRKRTVKKIYETESPQNKKRCLRCKKIKNIDTFKFYATGSGYVKDGEYCNECILCPKCKQIRKMEDFRDSGLITGYGRVCNSCKGVYKGVVGNKLCPKCNSKMILRKGRYGKFYGCSKFPYCRGTI